MKVVSKLRQNNKADALAILGSDDGTLWDNNPNYGKVTAIECYFSTGEVKQLIAANRFGNPWNGITDKNSLRNYLVPRNEPFRETVNLKKSSIGKETNYTMDDISTTHMVTFPTCASYLYEDAV